MCKILLDLVGSYTFFRILSKILLMKLGTTHSMYTTLSTKIILYNLFQSLLTGDEVSGIINLF